MRKVANELNEGVGELFWFNVSGWRFSRVSLSFLHIYIYIYICNEHL